MQVTRHYTVLAVGASAAAAAAVELRQAHERSNQELPVPLPLQELDQRRCTSDAWKVMVMEGWVARKDMLRSLCMCFMHSVQMQH